MPPAPTSAARSAKRTSRRRICCHWLDATLGLGPSLTLLGDDYPTPDGSCVRDFIHVSDLADAHLRALQWLQRAPATGLHEQFNVGSGSGYSVRQVMTETARIAGLPVPHSVGPRRPGDSPRLVGNIEKSHRKLGWLPKRDLDVQIEATLRWRRKFRGERAASSTCGK